MTGNNTPQPHPIVVGIAGKIGSGKNYLATAMQQSLQNKGYVTAETTYAKALKNDLTNLLNMFRAGATDEALSFLTKMSTQQVHALREMLPNTTADPTLTGWTKNEETRQACQYYGTDVRRAQDNHYWIKKVVKEVETAGTEGVDYMFIPDVRFPEEADSILDMGGVLINLDLPDNIIAQQIKERDRLIPSLKTLTHSSENALKNYNKFDLTLTTNTYNVENIIKHYLPSP